MRQGKIKKENGKYVRKLYIGVDEEGNRLYKLIEGASEAEVRYKEEKFLAKKKSVRQNEWIRQNRERLSVVVDVGTKDRIKKTGMSVNHFVERAIELYLKDRGL